MTGRTREEGDLQKGLRCWFCGASFSAKAVAGDGILRGRTPDEGGPYRLFRCPDCSRENLCERTRSGKWFASPAIRAGFFEQIFSQILDARSTAENLLASASWFRDNEDRRRHFFEREGDARYSGRSFLRKLFPSWKPAAAQAPRPERGRDEERGGEKEKDRGKDWGKDRGKNREKDRGKDREGEREREGKKGTARVPERSALVTPHEILGVAADAGEREIRAAFHRLAIHYHPDKARHLGVEFERVALEKFVVLKEAYEKLLSRRKRG
jgi:DnaJ-like protein